MILVPLTPQKFRRRIFSQLWMLALQFILGMALNLIGDEATGAMHTLYIALLVVHIVNAIGLVEGGMYIGLREGSRLSWYAAMALGATSAAGVLTVFTGQDVWSFAMASGFLLSVWLHFMLYVRADRALRSRGEDLA